jgi:acyl-CoA thioesterase-1
MVETWGFNTTRLLWFFAAGSLFFPGVGLLILALILPKPGRSGRNTLSNLLLLAAMSLIILSATPLPSWFYLAWIVLVLCDIFVARIKSPSLTMIKMVIPVTAIGFCAVAVVIETPFHFSPNIPKDKYKHLYVIGDSVSAGIGVENEQTWPEILRNEYEIDVIDLSAAGATVTSALKQAERIDQTDAVVFIEIGGNDLFARTPYNLFEKSISEILRKAADSGRVVIMLELPLRWFDIRYGRIQRRMARKFGAFLIPKHFLADIFATKGATVDLVHLSQTGHKLMAKSVWDILTKLTKQK